nr:MerR family DNA-binding protein [Marinobacterium sedimentorum]
MCPINIARGSPCHEADQLTRAHLQDVEAKIADLQAMRQALE